MLLLQKSAESGEIINVLLDGKYGNIKQMFFPGGIYSHFK